MPGSTRLPVLGEWQEVRMIRMSGGVGATLIAVLLGLTACNEEKAEQAATPPQVEVVAVKQQDVPVYQEWVGTLAGEVNADMTAQVSGYLLKREYEEGSPVKKGQLLFQIDPGPYAAVLERARAQLAVADGKKGKTVLDVKRLTPLAAKQAVSQQELDDAVQADKIADGDVAVAKAAIQQAQLDLDFTSIRSPVDGVAGLSKAQIGDLVGPSSGPLTTVTQVEPMRAYFTVSQQLVTELGRRAQAEGRTLRDDKNNTVLELTLASGYVYPVKGRSRFADNQVDVHTGSMRVVGEFPNPNGLLIPGMFVTVRARMGTDQGALLVPQRAVAQMQGRYLLAVVDADSKISIRPVDAGQRVGEDWVVKGKINAGDKVVAEGIQKVRDGMVVNAVDYKPPTTQPMIPQASTQTP
jgi:RND family efflux transporter MFP subunit